MRPRHALIAALALSCACTTVRIDERDAFDTKRTVSVERLRARGIEVTDRRLEVEDGVRLHARHLVPPNARGTVLFYGGNGFLMVTAKDFVEALLGLDLAVVMFDYRGYGDSDGEPSVEALKRDALSVHDWVTGELGVDAAQLVLHGHSLGTFVATYVATERPAAGVFLESPVTSVEDLTDRLTPWIADLFVSFDIDPALLAEDNRERVKALEVPVAFIVGEADNVSPKEMAEALYAAAPKGVFKTLEVVEGRGHNDLPPTDAYAKTYRALLDAARVRTSTAAAP